MFAYIGNQEMFLVINSLTVLFRFFSFLALKHKNKSLVERLMDFIIGFVWMLHHIIFVMLFFYKNRLLNEDQILLVCGLGFGSIFSVMLMIFLQIGKLITQIIILIQKTIKFIKHVITLKEEENNQNL